MCKRMLSLVLCLFLLTGVVLPMMAEGTETTDTRFVRIANQKNLEKLAENCRLDSYSRNLVVSLEADLDLEGSDFGGIPVFCGVFRGNGHTIRGVEFTRDGSVQGFFRYLTETAQVENLHLEGTVQPEGSAGTVGGFVGENSGILRACSFNGTVSGKEYIGGIAGVNTVTGILENCRTEGIVFGGHFVGGIAGKNTGTVRNCENNAVINGLSWQNELELTDITLETLFRSESSHTVTDVGGIIGNSTGMIRDCVNRATVGYPKMGYNVGGIAGTQSGSLLNCENYGEVFGRKEVGGIVGQMEPASVMQFQEDVVQILNRQLDGLGKAVNQATSNLQGAGESILSKIGGMYDYIWDAQDAVEALVPDPDNPQLPDLDTIQAARNSIGSSLGGMSRLMEGVGATAYGALGKVSTNLSAINDQLNAMRTTIGNISKNTGGTIVDRSDEDTELDFTGKVAQCRNYGGVQGDLNCGGIAGAISMENDLDMEEDWLIDGDTSLKFESELRAVIRSCENRGNVTAGKQNAGGIAGLQSLGLVIGSQNSGKLCADQAEHVGGISGRSMGFIRDSYANGELFGKNYVGGIAGSAAVATDCSALVRIHGVENLGAILGGREENRTEVDSPILGNIYLPVREDPGAIDGISYEGLAQPVDEEAFFFQENLPEMFRHVTVIFRYGNGSQRQFAVDFGSSFPEDWIPPIPPKDGRRSYWIGLEEADMAGIFFDLVFEQGYTKQTTVLESALARNALPVLFVQGIFSEDALLTVEEWEETIPLESDGQQLEAWHFRTTEPEHQTQIRLQLPEGVEEEQIRILIRGADQNWRIAEHHIFGRYAVSPLMPGDDAAALVLIAGRPWILYGLCFVGAAFLAGILIAVRKKKKP